MALTKIRLSNLTQPLDQDLSVPNLTASGSITSNGLVSTDNALITGGSLQIRNGIPFYLWNSDTTNWMHLQNTGTANTAGDARLSFTGQGIGEVAYITNSGDMGIDGSLVVGGNFTVSGNTTFVNSDNLVIEDLNIVLASGAANAAAADGAGLTVDGASATILYDSSNDLWQFNKGVRTDVGLTVATAAPSIVLMDATGTYNHKFRLNGSNSLILERYDGTSTLSTLKLDETGDVGFYENNGGTPQVGMHWDYADGRLGIGNTTPNTSVHVKGSNTSGYGQVTIEGGGDEVDPRLSFYGFSTTASTTRNYVLDIFGDVSEKGARYDVPTGYYQAFTEQGTKRLRIAPGGDLLFERNGIVGRNTSDGSDNGYIAVVGGGAESDGRGAIARYYGNEHATEAGNLALSSGNISGSKISLRAAGTNVAYVTSTGLGIGTDDPNALLDLEGVTASSSPILRFTGTGNASPGDVIGQIEFYNSDDTDNTAGIMGKIRAIAGPSGGEGHIQFLTDMPSEGADAATVALHLHSTGNVGIGTDSPNATLVVSTNGAQGIEFFPTAASGVSTTQYYNRSGAAYVRNRNIALDYTFNISGATDDAVTIASTGKVGIGIASPDHSLDVDGAIATGQVRHSKRPVFNFDFANSKELDSRFTFYRATRATYVDADGLVKYVNQNVPRFDHDPNTGKSLGLLLEENRSNEIIDPVNMYSSWLEDNCAIQRNYALAPDGTWSAIRIQPNGTNNASHAQQTRTVEYSTTYSISAYVKSDGADYAFLTFANTGFNGRATVIINLTNGNVEFSDGTSESSITPFVEQHKNGWWRFGLTVTSDSANGAAGSYEIGPSNEATPTDGSNSNPRAGTDPTKALLVWGPQREVGTHVSTYIPPQINFDTRTTRGTYYDEDGIIQSAPAYAERITHGFDGTKVVKGGPIVEPARDNLHVNSEWNYPSNPTICGMIVASGRSKTDFQAENTTAPDGSLWPIIITNAVTGGNYYYQNYSGLTTGVYYTFSVFFRLPTNNTESIRSFTTYAHTNTFGNYYYATYDFTTDSITQASASSFQTIQKLPNGWRRLSISAQPTTNGSFDFLCHFNAASSITAQSYEGGGVANKPIGYIFGPQLELGNQPTTYIPTGRSNNNAQIARAADVAVFYDGYRLDDLCDIYETDEINSDEGTVYTEWSSKVPASDGVGGVFEMWDEVAGGSNGIDQRFAAFYVTNNYSVSTSYLGAGAIHKTSLAYQKDNVIDWYATQNGTHIGTNTVHTYNMKLTRLSLGRIDLNPAYMINGHIKRFVLYNNRLSLDEQKALTENN